MTWTIRQVPCRSDCGLLLADFDKFHFKNQRGIGRYVTAGASFTIGQFRRDVEAIPGAFVHELEAFGPAGNDAVEGEADAIAAVEFLSINQCAPVVDRDGIGGRWFGPLPLLEYFILKSGSGGGDTGFFGILSQEFGALPFGLTRFLSRFLAAGKTKRREHGDAGQSQGWGGLASFHGKISVFRSIDYWFHQVAPRRNRKKPSSNTATVARISSSLRRVKGRRSVGCM